MNNSYLLPIFFFIIAVGAISCSLYWHKEYYKLEELIQKATKLGLFD